MRKVFVLIGLSIAFCCAGQAGEIALPQPQKSGGMPLFQAMEQRQSALGNAFPSGPISREALSTILWSASGLNRNGSGYTVPIGMGRPPYCNVYYIDAEAAYRYDYKKHALVEIAKGDYRGSTATQPFGKIGSGTILITKNAQELGMLPNSLFEDEFGPVLAGSMGQNVYLACEALNIGARLVYSVDRKATAEFLKLPEGDTPICAIVMGGK